MDTLRVPIQFTEVTLRDGEQQEKIHDIMPIADRVGVFDELVVCGMQRIEIGHLGNEHDVELAKAIIGHIASREAVGDSRYKNIELQVLFGSQTEIIEQGIRALDGFPKERVVVHVYDRVSPGLRDLASEPYTARDSADRVIAAASIAQQYGFSKFSISGEGTVDPELDMEEAVNYYARVANSLRKWGATEININMANTFGSSVIGEWQSDGLRYFNDTVKERSPGATTSIHTHNDYGSAVDFAIAAVRAGFDRIEGTMIGMGERAGNVAIVDVAAQLLEDARVTNELLERSTVIAGIGSFTVAKTLWGDRYVPAETASTISNWFGACERIAETYGTQHRFTRTAVGNPEAYNAGSGPHDHASKEALRDPVGRPLHRTYGRVALVHAMLGRPEAVAVVSADPSQIEHITVGGHASGGSTRQIQEGSVAIAPASERQKALEQADAKINAIYTLVAA